MHYRHLIRAMLAALALTLGSSLRAEDLEKKLLGEFETVELFTTALTAAEKDGAPAHTLLMAQLIQGLRFRDVTLLRAAIARGKSVTELTGEDKALLTVARAVIAGEENRFDEAEREFKEAFWMEPGLGQTIGSLAENTRTMQRMGKLTVDLDRSFHDTAGKSMTLRELVKGKKALLIDFWASWCGPCMRSMPELKEREKVLKPAGIVVLGMNTEKDVEKAKEVQAKQEIGFTWLLDDKDKPLDEFLEIDSIPRAILVSPTGKILYNGHPADSRLERLLATMKSDTAATPK